MGCIKYSNDKNKMAAFIQDNPRMNMEIEAARVIEVITHAQIESEEVDSMGNVDMCKALQDMMQDSREEGRLEASFNILSKLIQSGKVTVKEAAALMNMTSEEFLPKQRIFLNSYSGDCTYKNLIKQSTNYKETEPIWKMFIKN